MKALLRPSHVLALALLASGCSSTRQAAGGLSVASGILFLGGAGYVAYAGADAPPQVSATPYVLSVGASAVLSATFFTLAAHLLGGAERAQSIATETHVELPQREEEPHAEAPPASLQPHGATPRRFSQGHGATPDAGSWGHPRGRHNPGFAGSWGHPIGTFRRVMGPRSTRAATV